jgi:L,D-transpeptidase catalytic domain
MGRAPLALILSVLTLGLAGKAIAGVGAAARKPAPCPETGQAVAVVTSRHELLLCTDGTTAARFAVSIGRGGVDKHRQGDARTPLGTYPLGSPRPSLRYGTFIPIGYPTPEQAARGFTGGSVGIHGPPRDWDDPSYPLTALDWTLGCIATGSDAEVETVAEFVRTRQPIIVIY